MELKSELENELEKAKKEFMELISDELGIPKDLMTKGAINLENGKTKIDFREHAPRLDLDEFNVACEKMKTCFDNFAKSEIRRNDELVILQILWVYEANANNFMYRNFIDKLKKEMAEENVVPISMPVLTKEQVEFINSLKRTSRDEMEAKFYVKTEGKR